MSLRDTFLNLSIKKKLELIIVIVSSTAILFVTTVYIAYEWSDFRRRSMDNLMTLADMIGDNCASALSFNDAVDASEVLHSLKAEKTIEYACVYNPDGNMLAYYRRDENVVPLNSAGLANRSGGTFRENRLIMTRDVMLNNRILGTVMIQSDQSELTNFLKRSAIVTVLIFIFSVGVSFLLARRLQGLISKPIYSLADTAQQISAGEDYSVRADKHYNDELGILTEAFNEMIDKVAEREAKLREAKVSMDIALSSSNIGPWNWDLKSNIVIFSPEWKKQIGYQPDELTDSVEEWKSRLHPDDKEAVLSAFQKYMEGARKEYSVEFRLQHKNGSYRWILSRAELHRDDKGEPERMIGCHVDITDIKQMELQLVQSEKLASLGTLVAGIAHEINNPTVFITLNSDCLKQVWEDAIPLLKKHCSENNNMAIGMDSVEEVEELAETAFQHIDEGTERIKHIVEELKAYSSDKSMIEKEDTNVNIVIKSAITLTWNSIKNASDHFSSELAEDIPEVSIHAQRLEQVIINLITNACQAMDDRSKSFTIASSFNKIEKAVIIEVRDEGKGMSREVLARIMDPFFTTKRETGGTGLGLSICSRIMNDMGGSLTYSSAPGKGTTATVSIPLENEA